MSKARVLKTMNPWPKAQPHLRLVTPPGGWTAKAQRPLELPAPEGGWLYKLQKGTKSW